MQRPFAGPSFSQRPRTTGWVWLLPVVTVMMTAATVWFYLQNIRTPHLLETLPDYRPDMLQITIGLLYPILGAFIAQRRPGMVIGWLLCLMGLFSALYPLATGYAVYAFFTAHAALPLAAEMSWLQNWCWFVPIDLSVLLILLYPSGRVLSPRWRILVWVTIALVPALVVVVYIITWPYRGPYLLMPASALPPAGLKQQQLLSNLGMPLVGTLVFIVLPLAVTSLIIRLRQSADVERQQIKWFLFAGSVFGAVLFLHLSLGLIDPALLPGLGSILWNGVLPILSVGMALAVAFAIRRYHLFDIDLVIRRTLVYSTLTAALALIYFLTVVILQALLRSLFGQTSPIVVVFSTLLIAALFTPLRRWFQASIDRRFYRGRYNIEQAMAALNAAAQSEVDPDQLGGALLKTVDSTVRPEHVSLWLKK